MKIRKILEGDVIQMPQRKPKPQEKMPRFRTLCPDCGKPMRGGTDTRTNKRVRICMNCYKTIDESAIVIHASGEKEVFPDIEPRKQLQKVLKSMRRTGSSRDERMRQVKSYKFLKTLPKDEDEEMKTAGKRPLAVTLHAGKMRFYDRHFGQGIDAFRRGVDREANPHAHGLARNAWFDGWDDQARNKAS